jgi:hypothetical protein
MAEELRPEVILELVRARGLDTEQGNALLDATPAERQAAARLLLERSRELLEQAGVIPRQQTFLEAGYRTMAALAATFGTVSDVWRQPAYVDKRLVDVLKVIPEERAAFARYALAWGGLLPPEPEP